MTPAERNARTMTTIDTYAAHDEAAARAGTLDGLPRLDYLGLVLLDADTLRILREHLERMEAITPLDAPGGAYTVAARSWLRGIELDLCDAKNAARAL